MSLFVISLGIFALAGDVYSCSGPLRLHTLHVTFAVGMTEIVRQIAAGNSEALAWLYDQTSSRAFSIALRILRSRADAQEVTLDVYTYIWREAGKFNPERGSVLTWLAMLAQTRSMDRLRTMRSRTRYEVQHKDYRNVFFSTDCPEKISFLRQEQHRVRRALALLPPDQRQIIELAFFSGFTHAELAVHLHQPLGTVKTRIRTALKKLRSALKPVHSGSERQREQCNTRGTSGLKPAAGPALLGSAAQVG